MASPLNAEVRCPTEGLVPDDPITLVGLVFECAGGLRRRLAPTVEQELGVGGQAFEVLVRLERSPGGALRMADLAAQTGLTPSGLTRALDRLVHGGLCVRESCPSDRRGTFARLTPAGSARVAEALVRHRDDIDALLVDLFSDEERGALRDLLARLRDRVHPDAALVSGSEAENLAPQPG
ncbi:MAG TPA: MarR family winged helix-turn-helix transcriptional regulator [Acidimicrobiales bacterium]|nr:MarR family winged helix-turn-helix transcriptional regulator [Acidimicrobiales bacterium]